MVEAILSGYYSLNELSQVFQMLNFKCKKCKYLFTDDQLSVSPWKQIKSEKTKKDNESDAAFLLELIEEATRNVRCPKCRATVYLMGKDGIEIDVTSEPLAQIIKGLIDLHKKYKTENITPESFVKYSEETRDYAKEIVEHLMWKPGTLICFEDTDLMRDATSAIDSLYEDMNYKELSDEMFSGGYGGLLVNIIGDYIDRAMKLKPTLVSVRPNEVVSAYFQNAMECWLYGINSASVILCCSIVENLLKQRYPTLQYKSDNIFKDFKYLKDFERTLEEFIDEVAKKGFIDENTRKMAQGIRILRNSTVHKLKQITSDEAYNAIMNTKKIIEQLLK